MDNSRHDGQTFQVIKLVEKLGASCCLCDMLSFINMATQRFALGAIFVYQPALLYRFEHGLELCVGLKAFLKAA